MALSFINDENQLFKFVVKEGNGVKGQVDSRLANRVPGRYIRTAYHHETRGS